MDINLNKIEQKRYERFKRVHYKLHNRDNVSIIVSPTAIAVGFEVICNICKEKLNITDYNTW